MATIHERVPPFPVSRGGYGGCCTSEHNKDTGYVHCWTSCGGLCNSWAEMQTSFTVSTNKTGATYHFYFTDLIRDYWCPWFGTAIIKAKFTLYENDVLKNTTEWDFPSSRTTWYQYIAVNVPLVPGKTYKVYCGMRIWMQCNFWGQCPTCNSSLKVSKILVVD